MSLSFWKMSGAGNDFIVLNPRVSEIPAPIAEFVRRVCTRRLSAGADGVILVEPSESREADVRIRFFNPDGGEFDTCGNGSRCAARFAHETGLAPAEFTMATGAGPVTAVVRGDRVRIGFTDPRRLDLSVAVTADGERRSGHRVEFGVPHFVLVVDRLPEGAIEPEARAIRNARELAPEGANVNYVEVEGRRDLAVRTYERGVEGETLACGSGCVSTSIALAAAGLVEPPVRVRTRSGAVLEVDFTRSGDRFTGITLEGDARVIYRAELGPDATEWPGAPRSP
ncbi:MAG: diaminopimelate epimerase [Gemmatimonadota bacterium]